MDKGHAQVTLRDVARVSGVSHQTVSRVVNTHPNVAEHTRDRVLQTIAELGYQRNPAARQLATGRSELVGIISYGVTYYGPTQMLSSIESALRKQRFGLVLASLSEHTMSELERAIRYVQAQSVDGVVIITPLEADVSHIKRLCQKAPFVLVGVPAGDAVDTAADRRPPSSARRATRV